MKTLVFAAAAALLLIGALAPAASANGSTQLCISEDTNHNGATRCVDRGHEGSVSNLANLGYSGNPFGCHGTQWPDITTPGWQDCASSWSYIAYPNDCIQAWTGNDYTGTLIMSVSVRPGDSTKSSSASSMGRVNDDMSSIHLGAWTGTRNSGHCVWS